MLTPAIAPFRCEYVKTDSAGLSVYNWKNVVIAKSGDHRWRDAVDRRSADCVDAGKGEVIEDIEEGRISFETEEGRVDIRGSTEGGEGQMTITTPEGKTRIGQGGEVPDWVPIHPATSAQEAAYQSSGPSGEAGHVSLTVAADAADVASYYKEALEGQGYEVTVTSMSGGGESISIVTGRKGGGSVVASVSDKGEHTQVAIQYNSGG